ncbi:hypothetical protein FKM82_026187, partial [Ascaphus truei]
RGSLFVWAVLYISWCLDISQGAAEDVDILQKLGLMANKSSIHQVPQGVIPFKSGVILTQRARIEAPTHAVIPPSFGTDLSLVLSLCSHRINNAFLFSVKSNKKKLELGVQFIPGKIIVYAGHKQSVYFDYNVHDGQWHNLAIDLQGQQVTLYTACGKQRVNATLHIKKDDLLDSKGVFLLGTLNQHSIQFEGAICQFDIYPSAKAAHNYCKYLKKQCRQADTYRPNLSPLIPLMPKEASLSVGTELPPRYFKNLTTIASRPELTRTTLPTNTASVKMSSVKRTTKAAALMVFSSPVPHRTGTRVSPSVKTMTATAALRMSPVVIAPLEEVSATATQGLSLSQNSTKSKKQPERETKKNISQKTSTRSPGTSASSKPVKRSTGSPNSMNTATPKQVMEKRTSTPSPKNHTSVNWKVDPTISVLYTKPASGSVQSSTSVFPDSFAVTPGYQWLEPTPFPFLIGPPGPKGDQGPS